MAVISGSELVLTYDGQPVFTVSILEMDRGKVIRETQYFTDPLQPDPPRVQWVESID